MNIENIIKKTEHLITLISNQKGQTIFSRAIKDKTEKWVADHYSDLSYIFKRNSLEQKALNYLKEAYKKERLLKQACLKNLKIILYSLKDQRLSSQGTKSKDLINDIFVDKVRLAELKRIKSNVHDLSRLIRMCEELNDNFSRENYISVIVLVRTIINHVAPVFGFNAFSEVVNNYKYEKSIKDSLQYLESSSRKIADGYLHIPLRKKEILPTRTQVNFAQDLDLLLGEVIRILK